MALTKTIGGKALPASSFLVVEDSAKVGTWHLPVKDATGRADAHHMGEAYAALTKGLMGNKYSGPQKSAALARLKRLYKEAGMDWPGDKDAKHTTEKGGEGSLEVAVQFGRGTKADDGWVVRTGKLFDIGVYFEDKKFELSPDDALEAVANFVPVPVDSEHEESVFDGKMGEVEGLSISDGYTVLFCSVRVPAWLDTLFKGQPLPVSATWDRATKRLRGIALAKTPRISDAAIFAAFSQAAQAGEAPFAKKHKTAHGQRAAQYLHDGAVQFGAVCKAGNDGDDDDARMSSSREHSMIQRIHDEARAAGAICDNAGGGSGDVAPLPWYTQGKTSTRSKTMNETKESKVIKFWKWLIPGESVIELTDAEQAEAVSLTQFTTPKDDKANESVQAEFKKRDEQIAAMSTALATERAKRIEGEATNRVDALIHGGKALPAEREALIAAFAQAATDDSAHGVVTFSGKEASRVSVWESAFAARAAHGLTKEEVADAAADAVGTSALFNKQETERTGGAPKPMTPERQAFLLKQTEIGQQAAKFNAKSPS